jgi:hypothetical protein
MFRRLFASLAGACFLVVASVGYGRSPGSCTILVRQVDGIPGQRAQFSCSEEQSPCLSHFLINSYGRPVTLFVRATSIPGNLYVKFVTEENDLSIGSHPYLHLAVKNTGELHQTLFIYDASNFAQEDNPTALLHLPVLRAPGPGQFLTAVRLDVDFDH